MVGKPSVPQEHWSFIHNFKQARWISNADLTLRIPIMLLFLAWIYQNVQRSYVIHVLIPVIHGINFLLVPLHTLIICRNEMDRMYLIHIIGVSVSWMCSAIYNIIRTATKTITVEECGQICMTVLLSVCFLIWSVPTRILYFRIFHIARETLDVNANFLFSRFIVSLIVLFTLGVLSHGILILVQVYCPDIDHNFLRIQMESILFGLWTLFEIFMYSEIDPFRRMYKTGLNDIEKAYIGAGMFLVLKGIVVITMIFFSNWKYPIELRVAQRVLIRLVLIARFILLWHYCVNELKRYTDEPESIEENVMQNPDLARGDVVDMKALTKEQLERMEV